MRNKNNVFLSNKSDKSNNSNKVYKKKNEIKIKYI